MESVSSLNHMTVQQFATAKTRELTLPPEFCDGSTYRFTVASMDRCGRVGPAGPPVEKECCEYPCNYSVCFAGRRGSMYTRVCV